MNDASKKMSRPQVKKKIRALDSKAFGSSTPMQPFYSLTDNGWIYPDDTEMENALYYLSLIINEQSAKNRL